MCQALCEALKSWFLLRVRALVPSGEGSPAAGSHGQELFFCPRERRRGQVSVTVMLKTRMVTISSAMYGAYYMPGTVRGALHILTQFSQPPYEVDLIISVLQMRKLSYTEIR